MKLVETLARHSGSSKLFLTRAFIEEIFGKPPRTEAFSLTVRLCENFLEAASRCYITSILGLRGTILCTADELDYFKGALYPLILSGTRGGLVVAAIGETKTNPIAATFYFTRFSKFSKLLPLLHDISEAAEEPLVALINKFDKIDYPSENRELSSRREPTFIKSWHKFCRWNMLLNIINFSENKKNENLSVVEHYAQLYNLTASLPRTTPIPKNLENVIAKKTEKPCAEALYTSVVLKELKERYYKEDRFLITVASISPLVLFSAKVESKYSIYLPTEIFEIPLSAPESFDIVVPPLMSLYIADELFQHYPKYNVLWIADFSATARQSYLPAVTLSPNHAVAENCYTLPMDFYKLISILKNLLDNRRKKIVSFKVKYADNIEIDYSECDSCLECINLKCPALLLGEEGKPIVAHDKCIKCSACYCICKRDAIKII